MSEKSKSARPAQSRTDTMIGAGMRVEGHVAFTGVLRVQGDVLGDVACQGDAGDTIVVDGSGSVTGTLNAPRVVVRGRVIGPVHSSQSIDVQPGGSVVGDAFYKTIDIHAGGVVEGSLTPAIPVEEQAGQEHPAGMPASSAMAYDEPAAAGGKLAARFGGARTIAAAMLAVAVIAAVWMSRSPVAVAPRAADAVADADAKGVPAAQPAPQAAAEPAAPPAPVPQADTAEVAQASSPERPSGDAGEAVTVQGVNPAKPAGVFLLIAREPTVLFRKKRQDGGEGKRIEVAEGKTVSVAIGRNELFRVAEGRDLEIFYQGRKVTPKIIESGTWMSFVPQSSRAAGEDR